VELSGPRWRESRWTPMANNFHVHYSKVLLTITFDHITTFVNLGFFLHFETTTNIRTWIKSPRYWRML
jgi:hypothetical protein